MSAHAAPTLVHLRKETPVNPPRRRRSLAALGTVIACLATMAVPTAATVHTAALTGGQLTLTKTGVTEVIDAGSTTSCTLPSTIQVDDGTGTTLAVTALNASHVQHFSTSASYLMVLTRSTVGNSAGTLNSTTTPHTITSMRVAVVMTFYNTTSCTPTGTPVCNLAVLLHLSGTSTSTSAGSNFTLTGTSVGTVVANPTCTAGPSHIIGTSAATTSALTWTVGTEVDHDSSATDGTLTFTGTGADSVLPVPGSGTNCGGTADWLVNHVLHTGKFTAFNMKLHSIFGGAHYVAVMTLLGSTLGQTSKTADSGVINSITSNVQIDFFLAANQSSTNLDCIDNGEARRARFTANFHFTGTYNHTSTSASMQAGNTFHVSSNTVNVTPVPTIQTPFDQFNAGTARLASWSGTFA